jgi:arsenate reductase-like glutaredoxin family protein
MRIYGLKTCDTCRAALRDLVAAGHAAELIDLREVPMAEGLRARALAVFGEALVNRRSTTWRGLDEAARATAPEKLLAAHPALMKRPLIVAGDAMYLGWDGAAKAALLG